MGGGEGRVDRYGGVITVNQMHLHSYLTNWYHFVSALFQRKSVSNYESDTLDKLEVMVKAAEFKVITEIVCKLQMKKWRTEKSVLGKHGYEGLSDKIWQEIYVEIENKCLTTLQFLVTLVNGNSEGKMAPICLLYSIPMFLHFPELSRLQRLNTILLTDGVVNKMVGFCSWMLFF